MTSHEDVATFFVCCVVLELHCIWLGRFCLCASAGMWASPLHIVWLTLVSTKAKAYFAVRMQTTCTVIRMGLCLLAVALFELRTRINTRAFSGWLLIDCCIDTTSGRSPVTE